MVKIGVSKSNKGMIIQFGANTAPLNKALKQLDGNSKAIQTELTKVNKALKFDPKNTELVTQKQTVLKDAISATTQKLDALKQTQEKVNKAHAANADWEKQYAPIKKELDETTQKMKLLAKQEADMKRKLSEGTISTEEYNRYQEELQQVTQKHKDLMQSKRDLEKQFSDGHLSDQEYREYQRAVVETESKLKNLESQLKQTGNSAAEVGEKLQTAGGKIQAVGGKLSKAGNTLSVAVTAPIVAAGTASAKLALDAETSYAKVGTIIDETVVSYDQLKTSVVESSDRLGIGVSSYNEALYQTVSATNDSANAIKYTDIAVKAAKAGFTDAATAVDGLTTAMNSYGLKGEENMMRISDQMLIAQNVGKTTFGELASTMGQVVPITAQLNMGTEVLFATLATLTKNGIGTSQAVTGLKAALSNVIKPSTEAAEAAATLGVDFSASALQSKGLVGFMRDIKDALEKASPEFAKVSEESAKVTTRMAELSKSGKESSKEYKQLAKTSKALEGQMETLAKASDSPIGGFSTLFGSVEGLNSMMVLASETGAKDMENALAAMENSTGATQKAFEKMDAAPAAQMQKELNKLKNAGISVGEKLIPLITTGTQLIGNLATKFGELNPKQQKTIVTLALLAAAGGPAIKALGGITKGVGGAVSSLGTFVKAASGAETGAKGLAAKLGNIAASGNPVAIGVGLAVTAIGALAISVATAKTEADKLLQSTVDQREAWEQVKDAADEKAKSDLAQVDNTQMLWEELQTLVDAQGFVAKNDRDRVDFIRNELESVMPGAIQWINDETIAYGEAATAIEKKIKMQRAEILLEAEKEKYTEASKRISEAEQKQAEVKTKLDEQRLKVGALIAQQDKYILSGQQDIAVGMQQQINVQRAEMEKLETAYTNATDTVNDCYKTMSDYQEMYTAFSEENYQDIDKILQRNALQYKVATGATKEQLKQQVEDAEKAAAEKIAAHERGDKTVTQLMVDQSIARVAAANEEYKRIEEYGKTVSSKLEGIAIQSMTAFKNTTTGQIVEMTPELRNQMRSLGFDTAKSFAENLDSGAAENFAVVRDAATGNITEFRDATTGAVVAATPGLLALMDALGFDMNAKAGEALKRTNLEPPSVKEFQQGEEWGEKAHANLQSGLNSWGALTANVKLNLIQPKDWGNFDAIQKAFQPGFHAKGGIVKRQQLSWLAEGNKPETVIPHDPALRTRAVNLWEETGKILGVDVGKTEPTMQVTRVTEIDYNKLAQAICAATGTPINQVFNFLADEPTPAEKERRLRMITQQAVSRIRT